MLLSFKGKQMALDTSTTKLDHLTMSETHNLKSLFDCFPFGKV